MLGETILVELSGEKNVVIRALIDSGAQRSFIKRDMAREIGLKSVGKEEMCHGVFGGTKTEIKEHILYNVNIGSIDKKFSTKMIVIEENNICGYIPKVNGSLMVRLKQKGIVLTEMTDNSD
ncbi:hypothetical protein ACJJTC_003044 [Scirpophaga incertulas]